MSGLGVAAYGPVFEICAAVSFAVAYIAWRRRPAPGALGLALWSASSGLWALAYAVQLTFAIEALPYLWVALRATGTAGAVAGFFVLAAEHADKRRILNRWVMTTLVVVPVFMAAAILTESWHGLYLGPAGPSLRVVSGGPLFSVNAVYLWVQLFVAVVLLAIDFMFKRGLHRLQTSILLAAIAFPGVVMGAEMGGYSLMPGVNATPVAFGVACVLVSLGLFRLGLFDVVPVAREHVIENMPLGMLVFDPAGKLVDFNPAARSALQLRTLALGCPASMVFDPVGLARDEILRAMDAGSGVVEVRVGHGGPRVLQATVSAVHDEQGECAALLVIMADVTERLEAERQRREFVANASHELQTPLSDLALLGSTLEHVAHNNPDQLDTFIGLLKRETDRLVNITRSLLTLSRLDEQEFDRREHWVPVDMAAVVRSQVLVHAEPAAMKQQQINVDVTTLPPVHGDERALSALVGNLLENAIRYTDVGGRISVQLRQASGDYPTDVVLAVQDNGIGIAAEDQARVFERFYRVDRARSRETGGTGLGLSIVQSIAERHGGVVSLVSEPDRGTIFTVTLPGVHLARSSGDADARV